MDLMERLVSVSQNIELEPTESVLSASFACQPATYSGKRQPIISRAILPNGKRIRLLKTLLTSACERNCFYCPFRAGRDYRRETLSPDEMAAMFIALQRAGVAEGLFLSSGIVAGSILTQDKLLATAEILRLRFGFQGYLHLKLMPGAEYAQVERAMQLSDRLSVNLEAPNSQRLELLAPRKIFLEELIQPFRWVTTIRHKYPQNLGWKQHWPSTTTQFVVGAVGERDVEILSATHTLMQKYQLSRAYFSRFKPFPDTPFENLVPETPERELRLYQASFLLRDYGFNFEELPFTQDGNLPTGADPKTVWAQEHLSDQPVELNTADPKLLLRVPGFGQKAVQAILKARRLGCLRSPEELYQLGINPRRSLPYLLLDGRRPPVQLGFNF